MAGALCVWLGAGDETRCHGGSCSRAGSKSEDGEWCAPCRQLAHSTLAPVLQGLRLEARSLVIVGIHIRRVRYQLE